MKTIFTKSCYVVALVILGSLSAHAQKANVGIGTTQPNESAVLDISSSNKGLLIPRMTLQQRNTIQNPANGLMVYQTDLLSGFYFFDGREWKPLTEAKSVAGTDGDWTTSGNSISGSEAIGTTNNKALNFITNNTLSGVIDPVVNNLFFGTLAGRNSTGADNVGIGKQALYNNTSGDNNLSLGSLSLYSNTTGYLNIGIGSFALNSNTTGNYNAGIGFRALYSNTVGLYNMAIGLEALKFNITGNYNNAIGVEALLNNTSGASNFAAGKSALRSNTTGSNNFAFGNNALYSNTTGIDNVVLGSSGLYDNVGGNNNTALGILAGKSALGSSNIFIGYQAGYNETGSDKLYISNTNTANPLIKGDFAASTLKVNSKTTGFFAVGDFDAATPMPTPAGYRLIVQDGILTEKVKVALKTTADWADYVFEPSYKLMSLDKVEAFTKENKHLPNVPSATEMANNGLDVSQTSKMFMEKIEELTLYMIELNKEVKALKTENEALKAKLNK